VALDDELNVPWTSILTDARSVDEEVREVSLNAGVKVNLWLLEDDGGVGFDVKAFDDDG
jgi:hypothetical protein